MIETCWGHVWFHSRDAYSNVATEGLFVLVISYFASLDKLSHTTTFVPVIYVTHASPDH
jgi:hypothetical protein